MKLIINLFVLILLAGCAANKMSPYDMCQDAEIKRNKEYIKIMQNEIDSLKARLESQSRIISKYPQFSDGIITPSWETPSWEQPKITIDYPIYPLGVIITPSWGYLYKENK